LTRECFFGTVIAYIRGELTKLKEKKQGEKFIGGNCSWIMFAGNGNFCGG
jgi:hypothetical protein